MSYPQKWAFIILLPVVLGLIFVALHVGSVLYKVRFSARVYSSP